MPHSSDLTHDCYNALGEVLILCYITDPVLSISESPDNEALTRLQADPTSRNNEMQPGSVKHKWSHMFPITAPGQKRPLTKQDLPKHSQASDRISTPNRKATFKDFRGELASTERRANQRKEASPNLRLEEQYPMYTGGEKMNRFTSLPQVSPYTENEDNVED